MVEYTFQKAALYIRWYTDRNKLVSVYTEAYIQSYAFYRVLMLLQTTHLQTTVLSFCQLFGLFFFYKVILNTSQFKQAFAILLVDLRMCFPFSVGVRRKTALCRLTCCCPEHEVCIAT